ncbi:DHH family phosphoesterase [Bremerella sp. T1]|uniref:DHH family phosphoesterase n=1 Tax=Bremerella sp. TYQ1 TaxID=3119568 RepID=UPI001CC9B982|nr:DHH family phosphoesterase [Bremerella volcania]UBM37955.1 DHH family phosphoesterase [Bremerella volcania]
MSIDWAALKAAIDAPQRFVLTSHVRPDCDALGSELGMAAMLRQMGKEVTIVNDSETPQHLEFIDPAGEIKQLGKDISAEEIVSGFDAFMVLDTSAWIQLGEMADVMKQFDGVKLILDHHVSQDDLGGEMFKDPKCEATGRLVYEAAKAWNVPLTQEMASVLFTAIATDTGWFRFPSVSGATYRAIGDLIDVGANPSEIYGKLFEQERLQRVNLRGRILSSAKIIEEGKLAYSLATKEDFEATGATPSDTEDAINKTMAVAGVEVAILFIELPNGEGVKASFRSRSDVDVAKLAQQFGGGGHVAAAGALVQKPLDEVVPMLLEATQKAMN